MSIIHTLAFHSAIESEYTTEQIIEILEECIKAGVDINSKNSSVLLYAMENENFPAVKFLIDNGAKVTQQILDSAMHNEVEFLEYLIANGTRIDPNNTILLELAIGNNNYELVELLIANGIDIMTDKKILSEACNYAGEEIIELLLKSGIDPNLACARDSDISIRNIDVLIKYGFDITNNFPFFFNRACKGNSTQLANYLIAKGMDCVNILHDIKNYPRKEILKLLLENGTDANMEINLENIKIRLLEYYAMKARIKESKLLFEYGADIKLCDIVNLTKLNPKIKELFAKHGFEF